MKRWHKVLLCVAGVMALAAGTLAAHIGASWDRNWGERVPAPALAVATDPDVVDRGRYLVHGPAHCSNCHVSTLEELVRADAGEPMPMKGGLSFPLGPVGTLTMANLTSDPETGLGRYTDAQLFRMLRHGIKPDGTASLWPLMPFQHMADDDLVAIVSYLRTLPPVHNPVAPARYTLMGRAVRTFAPPFQPVLGHEPPATAPVEAPTIARGEYLSRHVANCLACHTNHDPATLEFTGPEYGGGAEFPPFPGFESWHRSPNITPDPSGVLAQKFPTLEAWMARFRAGRVLPESPMHWGPFSRMSDADLEALYLYLNSLTPVQSDVGPTVFSKGEKAGSE
jgi:mono/diheme cytochrome c family protein